MTRVLVLDDNQNRHDAFARRLEGCHVVHAYTAKQAIDHLAHDKRYDLVCLDHDLDLVSLIDDTGDGREVADFIALHLGRAKVPPLVLVHSWNEPASAGMVRTMLDAGVRVVRREFSPHLSWLRVPGGAA
jgi:CheY-like chemotaxis protein